MNMQTGFGDVGNNMAEQYIKMMTNILVPVFEKSAKLAVEYSKACGRDTLLPEDMEYAMKYCAMYKVGEDIGSIFPDLYDEVEEEDEEEDMPTVDPEDCPPFERYTGADPVFLQMNEAYDRWDSWVPQSPTEEMLKNAINSNEHLRAGSMDVF
jgi:hypothetical protein